MIPSSRQPDVKHQALARVQFHFVPRAPWDEETPDKYDEAAFHPVRVGDLYDNNYKVIRKLGVGAYSTVWLANDIRYRIRALVFRLMCVQKRPRCCVESPQKGSWAT